MTDEQILQLIRDSCSYSNITLDPQGRVSRNVHEVYLEDLVTLVRSAFQAGVDVGFSSWCR